MELFVKALLVMLVAMLVWYDGYRRGEKEQKDWEAAFRILVAEIGFKVVDRPGQKLPELTVINGKKKPDEEKI